MKPFLASKPYIYLERWTSLIFLLADTLIQLSSQSANGTLQLSSTISGPYILSE